MGKETELLIAAVFLGADKEPLCISLPLCNELSMEKGSFS